MMNKKVLVAYASVSGSTGEVAQAIGEVIQGDAASVQVSSVKDVDSVAPYDAVILGSSIRAGKWLPEAFDFLDRHQKALSKMPVAYFTTCLALVEDTEDNRRTVLAYMEPVRQAAPQIEPVGLGLFAGSLDPNRLALPSLRNKLAPQGDYRDWDAIKGWAKEIKPVIIGQVASDEPVILRDAVLSYTDMAGADLSSVDLRGAELHKAKLSEANLHEAGLNWAELNRADLSEANLAKANLIGADLSKANLDRADLSGAILNGANLSQAHLSQANLSYADLNWADLRQADLRQVDLSYANLGWANFKEADLSQAILTGALYNNSTGWPDDFSPQAHGCVLVPNVE